MTIQPKRTDHLSILRPFQKKIYYEALEKGSGGLSLPMGSGKTLITLSLCNYYSSFPSFGYHDITLVVCSKTLISTWIGEIEKFFGNTLPYEVLHHDFVADIDYWVPHESTKIVITNINTLIKVYRNHNLKSRAVKKICPGFGQATVTYFSPVEKHPLDIDEGPAWLFSRCISMLIVDEAQNYINAQTMGCQALMCIDAKRRWLLSGTPFDEPVPKRLLGYSCLLKLPGTPRSVKDMSQYIKEKPVTYNYTNIKYIPFKGIKYSMVYRKKNLMYTPPPVKDHIITNILSKEERTIYKTLRDIYSELCKKEKALREQGKSSEAKMVRSSILSMLTYLRLYLTSPLIPIAKAYITQIDSKGRGDLALILYTKIRKLKLDKWLDTEESAYSTRIRSIINELKKYNNRKVVLFTSFRMSLLLIRHFIQKEIGDLNIFEIKSKDPIMKRQQIIDQFRDSSSGVLLLTYAIGSDGVNLQFADVCFVCEYWWNSGKTDQGKARINRYGQKSKRLDVAYFTSNTAIERAIYHKHEDKKKIYGEILVGAQKSKLSTISFKDVLKMINIEENEELLERIHLNRD